MLYFEDSTIFLLKKSFYHVLLKKLCFEAFTNIQSPLFIEKKLFCEFNQYSVTIIYGKRDIKDSTNSQLQFFLKEKGILKILPISNYYFY